MKTKTEHSRAFRARYPNYNRDYLRRHAAIRRLRRKPETPEYKAWCNMKQRCFNPNNSKFKEYGGRGIQVCERWRTSFKNFLADMGARPSPKHSLDRHPNNDGDYKPTNCRWATQKQQQNNRRPRRVKPRTPSKPETSARPKRG